MKKIFLHINAGDKNCGDCAYKTIFKTGLAGEFHPRCEIFFVSGAWGKFDMPRCKECIASEKLTFKT